MFLGEFEYRIDEKGRLPLPPRFRPFFKSGVIVAPSPEKCLSVYTVSEWNKMAESLASGGLSPSKMRKIYRAIFATAFHTEFDAQGRIALPSTLRTYAGLGSDVVVAGANNYLELWDKASWIAEKEADLAEAWQILESLEKH
ncbi:MAG: division/cell wall cluster transcriptional repressor MraZ [Dehalococcoidia bacterium]|jgi:MraZ protein|nr:division/cell wall cluster transcriptional repressor MraZ [Dehalococcoidia bacterium]